MAVKPQSIASGPFNFHISTIAPWTKIRGVVSSHTSVICVVAGGYSEGAEVKTRVAGNLHAHPGGDVQSADTYDSTVMMVGLCFSPEATLESARLRSALGSPLESQSRLALTTFLRIFREMLEPNPSLLALDCLGMEAISALVPAASVAEKRPPRWLRSVFDEIESDPLSDYALAALAERVSVDRSHLAREYRRFFGLTIGDHVRRARLAAALPLLAEGGLPLEDVALRTGFYDAAHLKRHLRSATGWRPSLLRSSVNGN